jgi:hypothetical protein
LPRRAPHGVATHVRGQISLEERSVSRFVGTDAVAREFASTAAGTITRATTGANQIGHPHARSGQTGAGSPHLSIDVHDLGGLAQRSL